MKNELKQLYRKNPDLAFKVARVLGYKIKAVENVAEEYKKAKKGIVDVLTVINKKLSMHSNLFKKDRSSNMDFVKDLNKLKGMLEKGSKFVIEIAKP